MIIINILDTLDGARFVRVDEEAYVVYAWFGGRQVHLYGINADSLSAVETFTLGDVEVPDYSRVHDWVVERIATTVSEIDADERP
jgi:hypothetical protein